MGRRSHHSSHHEGPTVELDGGSSSTVISTGGDSHHTTHSRTTISTHSSVYVEDPDKQLKLCLCCSFTWALFAIVLIIVALATDFWFLGRSEVGGMHLAYSYGVVKDCYYESDQGDSLDTDDDGWVCHKWEDTATHDHDVLTDDCKQASTVGLAFCVIGIFATAPVCIICILVGCCFLHDHRNRWRCINILAMCLLVLAVISLLISPSVVAGQCEKMNENFKWVEYIGPYTSTKYTPLDFDVGIHYSFVLVIIALFFVITALVCYLTFYMEWDRRIYRVHRRHYHKSSTHAPEDVHLVDTSNPLASTVAGAEGEDGHKSHHKHKSHKHRNDGGLTVVQS